MPNFAIKKFRCGTLEQLAAKIISAKNVDQARTQGESIYKPTRREFVGAQRVIY